MESDSIATADKNINEPNNGNNQDVIVVDGRGYENNANNKREIYTLVDVIEDNNLNEEIINRATAIIERITREMVPEIAEKVIKEEIEKLKKFSSKE